MRRTDEYYMGQALQEAKRGTSAVFPNPKVGCVIVKDGMILGRGFHENFGEAHAEVQALQSLTVPAHGATAFVTLEPCSHFGKTPPCSKALIDAGITKVVVGALDPHPKARGGVEVLKEAGVEVKTAVLEKECLDLNQEFFHSLSSSRPWISLKLAMTLDGKIARSDGSSKWITSEMARKEVHRMRANHQAILVGKRTLLEDDPSLNCRHVNGPDPLKVILDPSGTLPSHLKCFQGGSVRYYSSRPIQGGTDCKLEWVKVSNIDYSSLWKFILEDLKKEGIITLMVEGGANVSGFLIAEGLVDRAVLFYGPKIFGSSAVEGIPVGAEFELEDTRLSPLGDCFCIEGKPVRKGIKTCSPVS